jgi:hypothetical protein
VARRLLSCTNLSAVKRRTVLIIPSCKKKKQTQYIIAKGLQTRQSVPLGAKGGGQKGKGRVSLFHLSEYVGAMKFVVVVVVVAVLLVFESHLTQCMGDALPSNTSCRETRSRPRAVWFFPKRKLARTLKTGALHLHSSLACAPAQKSLIWWQKRRYSGLDATTWKRSSKRLNSCLGCDSHQLHKLVTEKNGFPVSMQRR